MMAVREKQLNSPVRAWVDGNGNSIDVEPYVAESDRQAGLSRRQQALLAAAGDSEPHRAWYVLRVAPRMEKDVDNYLRESRIECWLPTMLIEQPRRGGRKGDAPPPKEVVAWPGYMFVRVAATAYAWAGLSAVKGVVSVLGLGERPQPINDVQIEALRRHLSGREEEKRKAVQEERKALLGASVLVTDGPFASFPGVVTSIAKDGRAQIELMIFGRATAVDLDLAQLAKVR